MTTKTPVAPRAYPRYFIETYVDGVWMCIGDDDEGGDPLVFSTRMAAHEYISRLPDADLEELSVARDELHPHNVDQGRERRCEYCGRSKARYGGPFGEHLCRACRGEASAHIGGPRR